ncbi:MAG: hypothetical protein Q8M32_02245 [Brevundimonas sp.]|nr:hypothetical protein [Brevundimonas sp.]
MVECVAKEIEAAREDQRAEYDLSAQNRMAEWALWMMIVAAVTTALTAVALWFIKGTLDATREAVREAKRGSNAAVTMAAASHDRFIAERRPWMAQRKIEPVEPMEHMEFAFKVHFQNLGASPAFDVAVVFTMDVDDYSFSRIETAYEKFLRIEMAAHKGGEVVFPGDDHIVTKHMQFSRRALKKRDETWSRRKRSAPKLTPRVFYAVLYRSPIKGKDGSRAVHHTGGFFSLHDWKGEIVVGIPTPPENVSMVARRTTADFLVS